MSTPLDLATTIAFLRETYGVARTAPRDPDEELIADARAQVREQEGMAAGEAGRFRDAVTAFDTAIHLVGDCVSLLVARSMAWRALGQTKWALCDAHEALERHARGEPLGLTAEDLEALREWVREFSQRYTSELPQWWREYAADRAWNRAFRARQDDAPALALAWLAESLEAELIPAACFYGAAWLASAGQPEHALVLIELVPGLAPDKLAHFYAGGSSPEQVEQLRCEIKARCR